MKADLLKCQIPLESCLIWIFILMKICKCCKKELDASEFVRNRRENDGLNTWCKSCCREYKKRHYQKNKVRIAEKAKSYRQENRDMLLQKKRAYNKKHRDRNRKRCQEYYQRNREQLKLWMADYNQKNADVVKERTKKYREKNAKKIAERNRQYVTTHAEQTRMYKHKWYEENKPRIRIESKRRERRYMTNPMHRLKRNLRTRVHHALAGLHKTDKTMTLVGCSLNDLKRHIESKFQTGMTWENYGKWHVDHIKPCAAFDLSDEKNQRECFHYTNLQPLWAEDNLRKSSTHDLSVPSPISQVESS